MHSTKKSGIYLPGLHVLFTWIVFTNEFCYLSKSTDETSGLDQGLFKTSSWVWYI